MKEKIFEYHYGLRKSIIDVLHIMAQVIEKYYKYGTELHTLFIDFKQALVVYCVR